MSRLRVALVVARVLLAPLCVAGALALIVLASLGVVEVVIAVPATLALLASGGVSLLSLLRFGAAPHPVSEKVSASAGVPAYDVWEGVDVEFDQSEGIGGISFGEEQQDEHWASAEPPGLEDAEAEERFALRRSADAKWAYAGPSPDRFVNVAVGDADGLLESTQPIVRGRRYELHVNIGRLSAASAVDHPTAFPDELLPNVRSGHWLAIAAVSSDFGVPMEPFHLFLPREGDSWHCSCEPGGEHRCSPESRRTDVVIPLLAPSTTMRVAQVRVAVYYTNNLIQSLVLFAEIVEPGQRGVHIAHVDFTLSESLRDLDSFDPRALNILSNETPTGTHRLVFKGDKGFADFTFGEGEITRAMDEVRTCLLDIHIDRIGQSRVNRLAAGNRKSAREFGADLSNLAMIGYRHWQRLFTEVQSILELAGDGSPKTIQVARVPRTYFVYPWATIYDLPLDIYENASHTLCPLISDWDGVAPLVDADTARCPREAEHASKNVICPFGFWGLRYAIEHPTGTGTLAFEIGAGQPQQVVAGRSTELEATETQRHFTELARLLGDCVIHPAESRADVGLALAEPAAEFVYFYCHGDTAADGQPCLVVGAGEQIPAGQITTWQIADWPPHHWDSTRPLVVLNGCHTAALTPLSPVNFVDSFAAAGASGLLGTEITLDQKMASEAAEVFFEHFMSSQCIGIGQALRRTRLHFVSKGNLLGLAYTAYCSADLKLRRGA
ncbi:MAG: hypothetical protein ACLP1Q_07265 [Solirubrobacteraceae bacterium]